MEGTGETVERGGKGQEGVGEGGSDQVSSVGRDVSTLVVRVDGNVQSHQLDELLVVAKAEQGSEVGRVVLVGVNGRELAVAVDVSEDSSGNVGELGNEVHRVVKGGLPVVSLVDTVGVGLGEGRVVVELRSAPAWAIETIERSEHRRDSRRRSRGEIISASIADRPSSHH